MAVNGRLISTLIDHQSGCSRNSGTSRIRAEGTVPVLVQRPGVASVLRRVPALRMVERHVLQRRRDVALAATGGRRRTALGIRRI